jgi:transposase
LDTKQKEIMANTAILETMLMEESQKLPHKQCYTGHRIYEIHKMEGYQGSEDSVLNYVSREQCKCKRREGYLPLEFDPGEDAQMDWGDALAEIGGQPITAWSRSLFFVGSMPASVYNIY